MLTNRILIIKWELEDQLHQDVWYKSVLVQKYTKIVSNTKVQVLYILILYIKCFHRFTLFCTSKTPSESRVQILQIISVLEAQTVKPYKATSRFCWFTHRTSTEMHGEGGTDSFVTAPKKCPCVWSSDYFGLGFLHKILAKNSFQCMHVGLFFSSRIFSYR